MIFIFSPILGEDSHFDDHIFQMGWFKKQPVKILDLKMKVQGSDEISSKKTRDFRVP